MVVYREFSTKDKTMQDRMKEIIYRVLEESLDCQIVKDNIELNYLRIKDSALN